MNFDFDAWWKKMKANADRLSQHYLALQVENVELRAKVDSLAYGMRDVFPAAHRLALELECLLLDTKDTAAVSKWWDSANEALEQWREFCREGDAQRGVEGDGTASAGLPGYTAGDNTE